MEIKFMTVDDLLGWLVDNREDLNDVVEFSLEIEREEPDNSSMSMPEMQGMPESRIPEQETGVIPPQDMVSEAGWEPEET